MSEPLDPASVLKQTFGYERFKPLQREVIDRVLSRRETLVVMPTGGGKSLCYQIPALVFDGLTVVVSPLIALMKDQVEQLLHVGVPAAFLNSSLQRAEYQRTMDNVRDGAVKLLYVAPETLLMDHVLDLLSARTLDLIAIDEAHCISEWGHDFRREYRQLARLRERFPRSVMMALTATATPQVRDDIRASLGFTELSEFVASFNRENLYIEVVPKNDPYRQLTKFLKRFSNESGIIYCFSRKQVDELALYLQGCGFSARPYHAGLDDVTRRENQEAFIRDETLIIVATIAFGMGINKPNVRFVVHFDTPKSIEGYYQEIGRAGRDGLPSHCLFLYSYADVQKLRYFIDQKDENERKHALRHLDAMIRYAERTVGCRRVPLLSYFGEHFERDNCGACDNCLSDPTDLVDITTPAQKFLSCVKRVDERFGAAHVTDVLLGSKTEKVLKFSHDRLSTFGVGAELSRDQWMHLGRQMVERGYLNRDEEYGTLRLTATGYDTLKRRVPIMGVLKPTRERTKRAPAPLPNEVDFDAALFEQLRAKRRQIADRERVPAYVIFSDRTLRDMAATMPRTESELMGISGVGAVKRERYGEEFLSVVRSYCEAAGIETRISPGNAPVALSAPRFLLVGESYNRGETIEKLAAAYNVKQETILDHLWKFVSEGHTLESHDPAIDCDNIDAELRRRALDTLGAEETQALAPAFNALKGEVAYLDLKRLRLRLLCRCSSCRRQSQSGDAISHGATT